jgi:hypothetical protein
MRLHPYDAPERDGYLWGGSGTQQGLSAFSSGKRTHPESVSTHPESKQWPEGDKESSPPSSRLPLRLVYLPLLAPLLTGAREKVEVVREESTSIASAGIRTEAWTVGEWRR